MAIGKTDVVNLALSLVGAAKIDAITDNTKAARLASSLFETSYRSTAELPHNWKFLTARTELAELDEPLFGSYDYQFLLPNKVLRVIAQVSEDSDDIEYDWRREVYVNTDNEEFDVLLTNESTCFIRYIRDRGTNEAIAKWPGWFANLVALNLAIILVEPLKQDKVKKNQLLAMLTDPSRGWLTIAIQTNGLEDVDVDSNGVPLDKGNNDVLNASLSASTKRKYIQTRE